jgi:hypothetical protein
MTVSSIDIQSVTAETAATGKKLGFRGVHEIQLYKPKSQK